MKALVLTFILAFSVSAFACGESKKKSTSTVKTETQEETKTNSQG